MCNLKHAFEGQFFPAVSVKISEGKRLPVNKIYSKELRDVIDYMLNLNMRNRPTIAFLVEKTFLRKHVAEYINDFISNYRGYEANQEQINILKDQAQKFEIFDAILYLDNLKGFSSNNEEENNYNEKYINIREDKKTIKIDKLLLNMDNKNKKYETLKINNFFEGGKRLDISPKYKTKKLAYNYFNDNEILRKQQQNTINYNNYDESNENKDYFNSNKSIKHKKKDKKTINYNEISHEKKEEKNKIDNMYDINKLNNIINEKNFIISARIKHFKERSIKALGSNFYNKAYNYLKQAKNNNSIDNDIKREYLSNTFGKNNIGYWQLIDQILFLENILETS